MTRFPEIRTHYSQDTTDFQHIIKRLDERIEKIDRIEELLQQILLIVEQRS